MNVSSKELVGDNEGSFRSDYHKNMGSVDVKQMLVDRYKALTNRLSDLSSELKTINTEVDKLKVQISSLSQKKYDHESDSDDFYFFEPILKGKRNDYDIKKSLNRCIDNDSNHSKHSKKGFTLKSKERRSSDFGELDISIGDTKQVSTDDYSGSDHEKDSHNYTKFKRLVGKYNIYKRRRSVYDDSTDLSAKKYESGLSGGNSGSRRLQSFSDSDSDTEPISKQNNSSADRKSTKRKELLSGSDSDDDGIRPTSEHARSSGDNKSNERKDTSSRFESGDNSIGSVSKQNNSSADRKSTKRKELLSGSDSDDGGIKPTSEHARSSGDNKSNERKDTSFRFESGDNSIGPVTKQNNSPTDGKSTKRKELLSGSDSDDDGIKPTSEHARSSGDNKSNERKDTSSRFESGDNSIGSVSKQNNSPTDRKSNKGKNTSFKHNSSEDSISDDLKSSTSRVRPLSDNKSDRKIDSSLELDSDDHAELIQKRANSPDKNTVRKKDLSLKNDSDDDDFKSAYRQVRPSSDRKTVNERGTSSKLCADSDDTDNDIKAISGKISPLNNKNVSKKKDSSLGSDSNRHLYSSTDSAGDVKATPKKTRQSNDRKSTRKEGASEESGSGDNIRPPLPEQKVSPDDKTSGIAKNSPNSSFSDSRKRQVGQHVSPSKEQNSERGSYHDNEGTEQRPKSPGKPVLNKRKLISSSDSSSDDVKLTSEGSPRRSNFLEKLSRKYPTIFDSDQNVGRSSDSSASALDEHTGYVKKSNIFSDSDDASLSSKNILHSLRDYNALSYSSEDKPIADGKKSARAFDKSYAKRSLISDKFDSDHYDLKKKTPVKSAASVSTNQSKNKHVGTELDALSDYSLSSSSQKSMKG